MNRKAIHLPLALTLLALTAACGGSSDQATLTRSTPTPGHTRWTSSRMKRVRDFLATTSATITPTAHTPHPGHIYRIGALFYTDVKGDHFCSASVVASPGHNMLITAAHCIHGGQGGSYKTDLAFVPQYHDGQTPQGTWMVKNMTVDDRWIASSDPDLDVGFVTVAPLNGKNIADVLGADELGINEGFTNIVRVVGYPTNGDDPISCVNKSTQQSPHQMRFACNGYYGGTSGSPWLTHYNPATRTGHVVGVIGGYQQGGDTQEVSYSSYFDNDIQALYNKAVSKG